MPRDCTEVPCSFPVMYSPVCHAVSNIMTNKSKTNMPSKAKKESFTDMRNKQYALRQKAGIIGPVQTIGSVAGAGIGGFIGGPMGAVIGTSLGGAIGNGIGYLTGSGDYRVSNRRNVKTNAVLAASFAPTDSIMVVKREFIMDVYSGTGTPTVFSSTTFPLNPGQSSVFPWLSSIAANYEEYDIQGMVFYFISNSGNSVGSSNTSLGTVIMATEYDPTKPIFTTKQQMENYSLAVSCKPSVSMEHAIECKRDRTPVKQLYIRTGASTGADLRWSDFGNFTIATVGMQAAGINLGELWVTYKVKLIKPRLPVTIGDGGQIASYHAYRTSVTTASPLGTIQNYIVGSISVVVTGTTITFSSPPLAIWMLTLCYNAGTSASSTTISYTGAAGQNTFANASNPTFNTGATLAASTLTAVFASTATNSASNIVITIGTTLVGTTTLDLILTQLDNTITK